MPLEPVPIEYDLRTRTTLVCGALALAIAASILLRGRVRPVHLFFAAFAGDIGFWYLAQSFYGFFQAAIWERFTAVLVVLLPQFALRLFEAMIPREQPTKSRLLRFAWIPAVPLGLLVLTAQGSSTAVRIIVFIYVFVLLTAGLYQLGQRGRHSPSRATQRRVRFLVVVGALAGLASLVDFLWFLGAPTPPFGAVLSIVFLFVLAQALRHDRLLDVSEMLARLVVATVVASAIAGLFYILLTFIGGFNTMYLNAVLAAIVMLVLFEPLKERVEEQIQRVIRERSDLEAAVKELRRRLTHTLEVDEMAATSISALEESRRVTTAAVYLREQDGAGFERLAQLGSGTPERVEVATARALLDRLEVGTVVLEEVEREVQERRERGERTEAQDAILAVAELLGSLRHGVVLGVRAEGGDLIGLFALTDDRVRDAISPEEIALLEQVATQMGVVVENSRLYTQMQERDRLAVLGQMAAGLAHEIRNPLGAIKGAAQLLADPTPGQAAQDSASEEFLGIILEEVERLNRVVGNVLDLARPNQSAVVPIDVNAAVRRTIQVLSTELDPDLLEVEIGLEHDLPRVSIDPELLRQVLMNLIRNGAQAMNGRGTVRVSSRVRFGRGTRPGAGRGDETSVEITVADTGPGMSQKILSNLFVPFFTTRDGGTGLGLAISQRIVQGAGGRIEVKSYEGKGSTFSVVLPAAMEALGTPTPPPIAPSDADTDDVAESA